MPFTSKSLKEQARNAMQDLAPSAALVTLVFLLLTTVLSTVVNLILPATTVNDAIYERGLLPMFALFLSILLAIYRTVMGYGYNCWALQTARGQQSDFWTLLDGFGMVGRVIWMNLRIFFSILMWTMLLSMACSVTILMTLHVSEYLSMVLIALMSMSLLAFTLRYELATFLLHDYPEAGGGAAVRRSTAMMQGHIWQLVKLYLSFWPWYLAQFLLNLCVNLFALFPILGAVVTAVTSGDPFSVYEQVQLALSGTLVTVLALAAQLIIEPIFFPYRRIAVANFYRALSGELVEHSFSGENF